MIKDLTPYEISIGTQYVRNKFICFKNNKN